jgi:hypothetical protein
MGLQSSVDKLLFGLKLKEISKYIKKFLDFILHCFLNNSKLRKQPFETEGNEVNIIAIIT